MMAAIWAAKWRQVGEANGTQWVPSEGPAKPDPWTGVPGAFLGILGRAALAATWFVHLFACLAYQFGQVIIVG